MLDSTFKQGCITFDLCSRRFLQTTEGLCHIFRNTVVIQNVQALLSRSLWADSVACLVCKFDSLQAAGEEMRQGEKIVSSSFDKSILKEKPDRQRWSADNKSVCCGFECTLTFAEPVNHSGIKPRIDFFFLLPSVLLLIEQESRRYKDHSSSATLPADNNADKQTERK